MKRVEVSTVRARPMISTTVTRGLPDTIASAGVDPAKLFDRFGLSAGAFSQKDSYIRCSDFARLLEDAAAETRDDAFGLHFGARGNPRDIGPLSYAVSNAPTIAAAFDVAGRYLHLHNEAVQLSIHPARLLVSVCYVHANLGLDNLRQLNEYSMAMAINMLRMMAGSRWSPREVQLSHPRPQDVSEHLASFGSPVLFDCPVNAIVVEREFYESAVPAADPRLFQIMRHYLDDVLRKMPREDDRKCAVRKAIAEVMRGSSPSLRLVAQKLAISPRTLQRQLKQYDVSFKDLLNDTRRQFALEYLQDPNDSLTQIAFLLGYSEVSAFNRAFRKWSGKTPLHYRRSLNARP